MIQDQIHLWAWQIAKALQVLKQNRVIHRDLRMENIYIDENGNAVLGNYALAVNF